MKIFLLKKFFTDLIIIDGDFDDLGFILKLFQKEVKVFFLYSSYLFIFLLIIYYLLFMSVRGQNTFLFFK